MKRTFTIILAFIMIAALAACGGGTTQPAVPSDSGEGSAQPAAPSSSTPSGDSSADGNTPESYPWNDFQSMVAGEYFKGVFFREDYMSRAGIDKGLPVEQKSGVRIGIVAAALANPYFVELADSATNQAKAYGYEVAAVSYDQEASKMVAAIEDFITQGVDAIILDPMDMNSASLACANAAEAGVVVVAVGQPMPSDSSVLTSIYPYYYGIAFENASAMAKDCFDKDTKIVAGYIMGNPTWHSWGNGYIAGMYYTRMEQMGTPVSKEEAMIKGHQYYLEFFDKGKVDIPEANMYFGGYIGDAGWDEAGGMGAAEALISAVPGMNALLTINDFQAFGAITALENNGIEPGKDVFLICCCDGATEGLELIRDGKLYADANSAPALMGASAVELIHKVFEQGFDANDLVAHSLMPVIPLNSSNWEEYYEEGTVFAKSPSQSVEFKTTQQAFQEFLAAQ